jgi:hypothetical protein
MNSQAINSAPPAGDAPAPDNTVTISDELGIDNLIYRPPLDARWEEAWRVTEALLRLMRDEVRERGAQFRGRDTEQRRAGSPATGGARSLHAARRRN